MATKPAASKKTTAATKAAPAKKAVAPKAPPAKKAADETNVGPLDAQGRAYGTGRRKNAIARVWVKRGSGKITVNGKDVTQYFARPVLRMIINQPFATLNRVGNFDVEATVVGGGLSGQAGAVRHGLSRALDQFDNEFHTTLRRGGFLTRDSRVVERKKYGKRKARRSFQFSKR